MEASPLTAGDPREVARYQILRRLGAGGMGRVYLGRTRGGRLVAVKVVHPELAEDSEFRRRFTREVAAARRVNGLYTAAVIDADPEGAPAWLATAYLPGGSLTDAVAAHGPWPLVSVLALGAGLAEALEAIHEADVIHRDLKPSNVLLAADGPRLIDFGIARASDASQLTRTGMRAGTPGFMSPEQVVGDPVGQASDVFSLGAVLAYAATATAPFGTGPVEALYFRVVYEKPQLQGLPAELGDVVQQCLAKDPDQRPTVTDLLTQLDRLATAAGEQTPAQVLGEYRWLPKPVAHTLRIRINTPRTTPHPPAKEDSLTALPQPDAITDHSASDTNSSPQTPPPPPLESSPAGNEGTDEADDQPKTSIAADPRPDPDDPPAATSSLGAQEHITPSQAPPWITSDDPEPTGLETTPSPSNPDDAKIPQKQAKEADSASKQPPRGKVTRRKPQSRRRQFPGRHLLPTLTIAIVLGGGVPLSLLGVAALLETDSLPGASEEPSKHKPSPIPVRDATLEWRFDEFNNKETPDSSGNGLDGTLNDDPLEKPDGVLQFNGEQSVNADSSVINTTHSFSVSARVKIADNNQKNRYRTVVSQKVSEYEDGLSLDWDSKAKVWTMFMPSKQQDGQWTYVNSMAYTAADEWTHLTGVYDAGKGEIRLYVDGTLEGTEEVAKGNIVDAHDDFTVGGIQDDSTGENTFRGSIDDVRAFDRALSEKEVASLADVRSLQSR